MVNPVAPFSHCHPLDTALRPYSGQAVDLQEITSEPTCAGHADRPGIHVAEYCLVISQWHMLLWPPGDRQHSEAMLWVTGKDSFRCLSDNRWSFRHPRLL